MRCRRLLTRGLTGSSRSPPPLPWALARPIFWAGFAIATAPFRERFGNPWWDRVTAAIERGLDACERVLVEVVLCHGDYQPKNLIFDEAGQLQALIDWELAAFAPRLADLAHLLRYAPSDALEDSLTQGYGATCPLPDSWARAARCYDLARVSLGLSQPGVSGASDIPLWIEFLEGCVDALLRSDPQRLRRACRVFLSGGWLQHEDDPPPAPAAPHPKLRAGLFSA